MTPSFVVVDSETAAQVRSGEVAEWKQHLLKGEMLLMPTRPQWTGLGGGYRLRSKSAKPESGHYIWLERISGDTGEVNEVPDLTGVPALEEVGEDLTDAAMRIFEEEAAVTA